MNLGPITVGGIIVLGLILLSFPAILFLDLYVTPWRIPSTIIYAIPIIIASRFFGKVVVFTALSIGLACEFLDAWLEAAEPQTVALSAVSLLVIGMLSLLWADAERRAVSKAASSASFSSEEHNRPYEMTGPQRNIAGFLTASRCALQPLANWSIQLLSAALGIIYVWFGALKIFGVSPVSELVEKMSVVVPWKVSIRFFGFWEVIMGFALLFRFAPRLTLPFFLLQLGGTFMTFVVHPREVYRRGNPFLLTLMGEFIAKNLVLLAAGIVIGSSVHKKPDRLSRPSDGLD